MENKELTYEQSFTQPIIKYGRLTNLLGVAFSFIPALVVYFCFDAFPGVQNILSGWLIIFSIGFVVFMYFYVSRLVKAAAREDRPI